MKSCVYWIHTAEQTDVTKEGYIGVAANGAQKRFREHKCAARKGSKLPIHNAIRKYGDKLIYETVLLGSPEYCLLIEEKLRPLPDIGYNVSVGGVSVNLGRRVSEETRKKMSDWQKGKIISETALANMREAAKNRIYSISEETRQLMSEKAKLRDNSKNIAKARESITGVGKWKKHNADKYAWSLSGKVFDIIQEEPTIGVRRIANKLDIVYSKLAVVFKEIKAGWNPYKDEDWLVFSSKLYPEVLDVSQSKSAVMPLI